MKKHFLPNLMYALLLVVSVTSCTPQNKPENAKTDVTEQATVASATSTGTVFGTTTSTQIDENIRSIYQDNKGIYWFGTNAAGVVRYDPKQAAGKSLTQFTEKDGLANDQVLSIQEDKAGNLWLGTGRFGVSRYNGQTFTTFGTVLK
jgi:ligand-binding sensor domain-containing protein